MAVVHQTFLFDEEQFHRFLEQRIMHEGVLSHKLLLKLATETVKSVSPKIQDILRLLRFDPEWLTDVDSDVSHLHEWYILALAPKLSISKSINTRRINNHWLLSQILLAAGWNTLDVKLLLSGYPLHTMVEASGNDLFISEFSVGLDLFGGWMISAKAQDFLDKLQGGQELIFHPDTLEKLQLQHHQYFAQDPSLIVSDAYLDAIDMLEPATTGGKSLFIIFD